MTALADQQVQRNGIVFITYAIDRPVLNAEGTQAEREAVANNSLTMNAVPFRLVCMHCCYNMAIWRPFLAFALMLLGRHHRIRIRAHFGMLITSFGFLLFLWTSLNPPPGFHCIQAVTQKFSTR